MQTLTIGRSQYTLNPTRDVGALQDKFSKCTGKPKKPSIARERRDYPVFEAGMSTAMYVNLFQDMNHKHFTPDEEYFAPLNKDACTLYSGADVHELIDDLSDDAGDPVPVILAPVQAIPAPAAPVVVQKVPPVAPVAVSADHARVAREIVESFYDHHLSGAHGCTVPRETIEARARHLRGSAIGYRFGVNPAGAVPYDEAARMLEEHANAKRANVAPVNPAAAVSTDPRAAYDAATRAAAIELERITCSLPSDGARRKIIDAGRLGAIGARADVVRELEKWAAGCGIGAETARAALADLDVKPGAPVSHVRHVTPEEFDARAEELQARAASEAAVRDAIRASGTLAEKLARADVARAQAPRTSEYVPIIPQGPKLKEPTTEDSNESWRELAADLRKRGDEDRALRIDALIRPLPVHSAPVQSDPIHDRPMPAQAAQTGFEGLSDPELRTYIEDCHRDQQFGIDFWRAAREINDRKDSGAWTDPPTTKAARMPMKPCDRPMAAPGLTSYRARGRYGWIMIGARDPVDAMREAMRSTDEPTDLQVWDGGAYVPCEAPPSGELNAAPATPIRALRGAESHQQAKPHPSSRTHATARADPPLRIPAGRHVSPILGPGFRRIQTGPRGGSKPALWIPPGDLRGRIPARFAPCYVLQP